MYVYLYIYMGVHAMAVPPRCAWVGVIVSLFGAWYRTGISLQGVRCT